MRLMFVRQTLHYLELDLGDVTGAEPFGFVGVVGLDADVSPT